MLVLIVVFLSSPRPVQAAPAAQAINNEAVIDFPNTITFAVTLQGSAAINSVTLEYGTKQSTCGTVIGIAYPEFNAGTSIEPNGQDMRQSGSLPPMRRSGGAGAICAMSGQETAEEKTIPGWTASTELTSGAVHHCKSGCGGADAPAGVAGFGHEARSEMKAAPIDLYVYPTGLQDAILYEPSGRVVSHSPSRIV
jgi:hypothetical protein